MAEYYFVPNKIVIDNFLNDPNGQVGRWLAGRGRQVERAAKAQVGVNTGALRASIHMRHTRSVRHQELRIGSSLNYAKAHHEGTKPHLITPKSSQVLRFTSGSRVVYARQVMHPGTRPNKYLKDNLRLIF